MEYLYESIEHNEQLPIKIFTQTIEEFPFHWHEDTEFLFVLRGKIEISIDNQITVLKEGNIFIVNKNEFHFINSVDESGKSCRLNWDSQGLKILKYQDTNHLY